MKIWIDAATGTWGVTEDLFSIEVEDGPEAAMLVNTLEGLSDQETADYARAHGRSMD